MDSAFSNRQQALDAVRSVEQAIRTTVSVGEGFAELDTAPMQVRVYYGPTAGTAHLLGPH